MASSNPIPDSFSTDPSVVVQGPKGQLCHRDHLAHNDLFTTRVVEVTDKAWTVLGNGLANVNAVLGPEGLIVIDSGECIEELAAALKMLREHTDAPVAAVIYSHFHYVSGTEAIGAERSLDDLEIWGHERIGENLRRASAEIGPAYTRGAVEQFGIRLSDEGEDGLVNVGLGMSFINPAHAPRTPGYIPANQQFNTDTKATIAGLEVELYPAPSDADDSITIWFPTLKVAIQNLVWPAIFNVFPIRGETYRDPTVLLRGCDQLLELQPDHIIGVHGPPISGAAEIEREVTLYRDSIQYMWDQTVRGTNMGLTVGELIDFVQLPDEYGHNYLTSQMYGIVEHHVRQIRNGLLGWFDRYDAELLPLPTLERCKRMIEGFGGRQAVAEQAAEALRVNDLRWALELATWLVRSDVGPDGRADGGSPDDRALLASVLRTIGQRTTSANLRNFCLTRAGELDGTLDLTRYRSARFSARSINDNDPLDFVHAIRVQLDPARAKGLDAHIAVTIEGHGTAGLHIRNGVAAPTDGLDAAATLKLNAGVFAQVWSGRQRLQDAVNDGAATIAGDTELMHRAVTCFDAFAVED